MSVAPLLLALLACVRSPEFGGQTGEEMRACQQSRQQVSPGAGDAGFSATDWLTRFQEVGATLRYTAGGETPLTLTLEAASEEVTWVHQEAPDSEVFCSDYLIILVNLDFQTGDGGFLERFTGLELNAWSADSGESFVEREDTALSGSFRAPSPALLSFSMGWNAEGPAGQIQGSSMDSGEFFELATWSE